MSNLNKVQCQDLCIEEISEYDPQGQADELVKYYASTRNLFEPVKEADFSHILTDEVRQNVADVLTS